MRRMVVVLAASALVLAACGGDDDDDSGDVSEEEQPYVDAIAAQFTAGDEGDLTLTAEQADCVSPRWVDTIGVDRFEDRGVTADDITDTSEDELASLGLSEAEGGELYDAFEDCDVDIPTLLADSITAGEDLDDETVSCIEDAVDPDLSRRLMVAVITVGEDGMAGTDAATDLQTALEECAPS